MRKRINPILRKKESQNCSIFNKYVYLVKFKAYFQMLESIDLIYLLKEMGVNSVEITRKVMRLLVKSTNVYKTQLVTSTRSIL